MVCAVSVLCFRPSRPWRVITDAIREATGRKFRPAERGLTERPLAGPWPMVVKPQDAPPRFGSMDVFVGIICGRTGHRRSLVANGQRIWLADINEGRSPECRKNSTQHLYVVRRTASKWPNIQYEPPAPPICLRGALESCLGLV
jgi:hypothetical protein